MLEFLLMLVLVFVVPVVVLIPVVFAFFKYCDWLYKLFFPKETQ